MRFPISSLVYVKRFLQLVQEMMLPEDAEVMLTTPFEPGYQTIGAILIRQGRKNRSLRWDLTKTPPPGQPDIYVNTWCGQCGADFITYDIEAEKCEGCSGT